ncbi:MAG: HTTM domain-containing protein [Mariniblastus sp.]|nr:HTTM domain-containing protein [Mariniblastus sp.]
MNLENNQRLQPAWLGRVFSLDLRSLAVFRVAWGLTLIWDLIFRWSSLTAMYTDQGFFTRQISYDYLQHKVGDQWVSLFWSFYWLSGSTEFAAALFIITGLLAVLFVLGCWTRVVTVGLFLLLVSLHYRNPLVLTSGDLYFKTLLLWSIFLPLGKVWSWDARRAGRTVENQQNPIATLATVGFLFQIIFMYFFTGLSKCNEVWLQGDAMWYVLRLDIYINPFGRLLLDFPALLRLISWATLFFEVVWVWTLLIPWRNDWFRLSNLIAFMGFHVGIGLSMSIGLFPVICMIAWLPLLPGYLWPGASRTAIGGFQTWTELSTIGRLSRLVCGGLLAFTLIWNVGNIQHPNTLPLKSALVQKVGYRMGCEQHFQMFDRPPEVNPWFVYEAELKDGTRLDLLTGGEIKSTRPEWVREIFPTFHWRKMHRNMMAQNLDFLRQPLAEYWGKQWNETHGPEQQVVSLRLVCYMEDIGPDYNEANRSSVIWGSVKTEEARPGSLFDNLLKEGGDLPF